MNNTIQLMINSVQQNCHISDARHASDYTLCIYLLKMREFYRWEKQLALADTIDADEMGSWLTAREALWDSIQHDEFAPLNIDEQEFNCFDTENINKALLAQGYVYSAGYGLKSKAIFFLAELDQHIIQHDYNIYISGKELARDLAAPVAMSQHNNIYVRRESLQRMIWEKTVEWGWHQNKNAMFKAMNYYDFSKQPAAALEAMTNKELNSVILHEIGEIKSANKLKKWHQLIVDIPRSQAEIMARAIKDLISDSISTLPTLINNQDDASLHFYFANFTHMRKELSPSLMTAYQCWDKNGDYEKLLSASNQCAEHWFDIAYDILDLYNHHGSQCITQVEALVNENKLGASA